MAYTPSPPSSSPLTPIEEENFTQQASNQNPVGSRSDCRGPQPNHFPAIGARFIEEVPEHEELNRSWLKTWLISQLGEEETSWILPVVESVDVKAITSLKTRVTSTAYTHFPLNIDQAKSMYLWQMGLRKYPEQVRVYLEKTYEYETETKSSFPSEISERDVAREASSVFRKMNSAQEAYQRLESLASDPLRNNGSTQSAPSLRRLSQSRTINNSLLLDEKQEHPFTTEQEKRDWLQAWLISQLGEEETSWILPIVKSVGVEAIQLLHTRVTNIYYQQAPLTHTQVKNTYLWQMGLNGSPHQVTKYLEKAYANETRMSLPLPKEISHKEVADEAHRVFQKTHTAQEAYRKLSISSLQNKVPGTRELGFLDKLPDLDLVRLSGL